MEWRERVIEAKRAQEVLRDNKMFVSGLLSFREGRKEGRKVLVKFFRNKGFDGNYMFLIDEVPEGYLIIMYFFGDTEAGDVEEELGVVTPLL